MFRTCTLLILAALFFSCSKNKSPQIPPSSFKFTALANNYGWTGEQIIKVITTDPINDTCYYLSAHDGMNNSISLRFNATRIAPGTYTLTRAVTTTAYSPEHSCRIGSSSWGSTHAGDFATITITKVHDGWFADGFFSTKMSCMVGSSCANNLIITNGEFQNLQFFPY
jgi:hypothetical protein